jgi:hypothetical protein
MKNEWAELNCYLMNIEVIFEAYLTKWCYARELEMNEFAAVLPMIAMPPLPPCFVLFCFLFCFVF